MDAEPLLALESLCVRYPSPAGELVAVDGVDLEVRRGECVGIVGESGAGKSQLALAATGLLPAKAAVAGRVRLEGRDLLGGDERAWRDVRGRRIGFVFQDPMTALAPHLTVGTQIVETLRAHLPLSRSAARDRALALLARVRVPDPEARLRQFPHELSGGLRQRAMLAIALACDPDVIVADEPTTALDVTVQRQVLDLFRELRRESGTALVVITHDLGVVAGLCDRVYVMYAGRVVETAPAAALYVRPAHPYTAALLAASPRLDDPAEAPLATIPGSPPDPRQRTAGCAFRPRCAHATPACASAPELRGGRAARVACHHALAEPS